MTDSLLKAIPTRYNGTLFRSKLEADWARFFNALHIKWKYEPEGRYIGELFVFCDFFLPEINQWFEVKGIWTHAEFKKYTSFGAAVDPERLFVGGPGGLLAVYWDGSFDHAQLLHCPSCHAWRFCDTTAIESCPVCRDDMLVSRLWLQHPATASGEVVAWPNGGLRYIRHDEMWENWLFAHAFDED